MSEPGSLIRTLSGRQAARNFHSFVIGEVGLGVVSGRFKVGSILPNDAEMIEAYGVSRTVLREALKTLEAKGLVEARPRVGTRVLPRSRWNLFDRQVLGWIHEAGPDPAFLDAFFAVRRGIELQATDLAARHRTADQLRQLYYWLTQRQTASALVEPFAQAEFELHRILADASANPFLRAASPLSEFAVVRWLSPGLAALDDRGELDLAAPKQGSYLALLQAVEAHRPEAAVAAMTAILDADERAALGR